MIRFECRSNGRYAWPGHLPADRLRPRNANMGRARCRAGCRQPDLHFSVNAYRPALRLSRLHARQPGDARAADLRRHSYILYAFFIHFGSWFLVYVAVLGLSTYALFGSVLGMNLDEVSERLAANPKTGLVSTLLLVFGLLFALHWLSDIVPSLLSGITPRSITEIGVPVNPIHVLDLAFILPGMIVTAVTARKRSPLGLLFAAPLLTFSAAMGIAILSMFLAETRAGRSYFGRAGCGCQLRGPGQSVWDLCVPAGDRGLSNLETGA